MLQGPSVDFVQPLTDFFLRNFIVVYFFYGLSFFSMGLAILLEIGHSTDNDFAQALRPLAGFGLVHGSHEWFEMFLLIYPGFARDPDHAWVATLRIILLASSFMMLIAFGARLIAGPARRQMYLSIMLACGLVWVLGLLWMISALPAGSQQAVAADVYTRYSLAIPGAALTVWGLLIQRRNFIQMGMPAFGRDVLIAAIAFGFYGGIGQLFASPSTIFPSTFINTTIFLNWFGFPIQVFRAAMATIAAIFIIHSLRAFEVENRQRTEALREAQQAERKRLEATRAELLHRTVKAQESERQRIARELHDETGQTLTALGLGLRGLTEIIPADPERAAQQAKRLETMAINGLDELQRLVSGLHPPQLDDLGLMAALRWYANQITQRYGLPVQLASQGTPIELPIEVRTVVFRIAQEAITNTIRHSEASQALIRLNFTPLELCLEVEDNGKGFEVDIVLGNSTVRPCWGLLGMLERAALIGATCQILSQPAQGTLVIVCVPIHGEEKSIPDEYEKDSLAPGG
jgi:signal transduction histidine kinase